MARPLGGADVVNSLPTEIAVMPDVVEMHLSNDIGSP